MTSSKILPRILCYIPELHPLIPEMKTWKQLEAFVTNTELDVHPTSCGRGDCMEKIMVQRTYMWLWGSLVPRPSVRKEEGLENIVPWFASHLSVNRTWNLKMCNQNWGDVICDGSNWSVLNYNWQGTCKPLYNITLWASTLRASQLNQHLCSC